MAKPRAFCTEIISAGPPVPAITKVLLGKGFLTPIQHAPIQHAEFGRTDLRHCTSSRPARIVSLRRAHASDRHVLFASAAAHSAALPAFWIGHAARTAVALAIGAGVGAAGMATGMGRRRGEGAVRILQRRVSRRGRGAWQRLWPCGRLLQLAVGFGLLRQIFRIDARGIGEFRPAAFFFSVGHGGGVAGGMAGGALTPFGVAVVLPGVAACSGTVVWEPLTPFCCCLRWSRLSCRGACVCVGWVLLGFCVMPFGRALPGLFDAMLVSGIVPLLVVGVSLPIIEPLMPVVALPGAPGTALPPGAPPPAGWAIAAPALSAKGTMMNANLCMPVFLPLKRKRPAGANVPISCI